MFSIYHAFDEQHSLTRKFLTGSRAKKHDKQKAAERRSAKSSAQNGGPPQANTGWACPRCHHSCGPELELKTWLERANLAELWKVVAEYKTVSALAAAFDGDTAKEMQTELSGEPGDVKRSQAALLRVALDSFVESQKSALPPKNQSTINGAVKAEIKSDRRDKKGKKDVNNDGNNSKRKDKENREKKDTSQEQDGIIAEKDKKPEIEESNSQTKVDNSGASGTQEKCFLGHSEGDPEKPEEKIYYCGQVLCQANILKKGFVGYKAWRLHMSKSKKLAKKSTRKK